MVSPAILQTASKAFNGMANNYIQFLSNPMIGSVHRSFAALSLDTFSISRAASSSSSATAKKRKSQDPYAIAQARQRRAANQSRQRVLQAERAASVGDPVLGNSTPFIESLKPGQLSQIATPGSEAGDSSALNFFVSPEELDASLNRSGHLSAPVETSDTTQRDPSREEQSRWIHAQQDANAREAIRRITTLGNGNSKDKTRVNIQRCIETLGRHNTDKVLPPKPAGVMHPNTPKYPAPAERAGPDTGSSEVQVAILTSKILVLAKQLGSTSHKDKHNKRNLRLLVHRRQNLLRYLHRKERGGPRWQNTMNMLGLTDASWKGEISI